MSLFAQDERACFQAKVAGEMTLIEAGDIELDYERRGSGPPLLLIMGMSGTRRHWSEAFLNLLAQHFEVIAYDHRGVGASTRMQSPFTILDLASDAARLLEALEIDAAHLLGFSMGGMVAQELVLAHPERITTLTLAGTYCGGPGSALATDRATRTLRDAVATRDREQAVRAAWLVNVSESFAANQQAQTQFMEIGLSKGVASAVVMEQMRAIAGHDTTAWLAQIDAPTLIVHGSDDQMLPVLNAQLISGLMPQARLEIIEGAGHLFFWEQPERAAQLVLEHTAVRA
jgi:pimeloyl-ACP methyl ester carboxylesterase